MEYKFENRIYSDVEIVAAIRNKNRRMIRVWFFICRNQFDKGTSRYTGISDFEKEDLFSVSFSLMWSKMDSGQIFVEDGRVCVSTRDGVHDIPDLLGYFMRIVKNKYHEILNDGKHIAINETVTPGDGDTEPVADLYWDENPEIVKERVVVLCLQSLPNSCVEILTMFYYERKSLAQILEERPENTSYDGLKNRKSKCMSNLKKRIEESFAKLGLR